MGILVVAPSRSFAYFDFIVVIPESFFTISELCSKVGQHPDMGAVITTSFSLAAPYGGGNDLVKLSIPAYQELYILLLLQYGLYELPHSVFDFQRIFYNAMPKGNPISILTIRWRTQNEKTYPVSNRRGACHACGNYCRIQCQHCKRATPK